MPGNADDRHDIQQPEQRNQTSPVAYSYGPEKNKAPSQKGELINSNAVTVVSKRR